MLFMGWVGTPFVTSIGRVAMFETLENRRLLSAAVATFSDGTKVFVNNGELTVSNTTGAPLQVAVAEKGVLGDQPVGYFDIVDLNTFERASVSGITQPVNL